MPKTAVKTSKPKIKKDKKGRLYLKYGKKRIYPDADSDMPERKFLMWMMKFLKPKKRKPRVKKEDKKPFGESGTSSAAYASGPSPLSTGPPRPTPPPPSTAMTVSAVNPAPTGSSFQDVMANKKLFLEAAQEQTQKQIEGAKTQMLGEMGLAGLLQNSENVVEAPKENKEEKRSGPTIETIPDPEDYQKLEEQTKRAQAAMKAMSDQKQKAEEEKIRAEHEETVKRDWLSVDNREAMWDDIKKLTGVGPSKAGGKNYMNFGKLELYNRLKAIPGSRPNQEIQKLMASDQRLAPPIPPKPNSRRNSLSDPAGSGKVLRQTALRTSEVSRIMDVWNNYAGTICRNDLKALGKIKPVGGCVMNTDPPGKPGEHWVAIYWDGKKDLSIEYYDPFGDPCPPDVLAEMIKPIVKVLNTPVYLKFKENHMKNQSVTTQNCGWHCTDFLINRARGIPFTVTTGWEPKKISNVEEHEERIKKLKTQFPEFGVL